MLRDLQARTRPRTPHRPDDGAHLHTATRRRSVAVARGVAVGCELTVAPSTARVRFRRRRASITSPELVDELGARRVLVLASARHGDLIERVGRLLGARRVGWDARRHARARSSADAVRDDAIRSGSTRRRDRRRLADRHGEGDRARRRAADPRRAHDLLGVGDDERLGRDPRRREADGRDERVRPRARIYDPTLTLELPPRVSGPSGLNAMAHAVEALYAPDVNPLAALAATEGIRTLGGSVLRVVREPTDLTARTEALYAAWLCGWSLGAATMGLHHKLCHVLGGSFGLPHAETHAVVLPHAVAY